MEQVPNAVRTGKAGLFRHGQPMAHLVRSLKEFVAFLWQIAPIVPVLPTHPTNKPITVNKLPVECHLHTVEVVGSNPAAPTNPFNNLGSVTIEAFAAFVAFRRKD